MKGLILLFALGAPGALYAGYADEETQVDRAAFDFFERALQSIAQLEAATGCKTQQAPEPDYCVDLAAAVCEPGSLARNRLEEQRFLEAAAQVAAQRTQAIAAENSKSKPCQMELTGNGQLVFSAGCFETPMDQSVPGRLRRYQESIIQLEKLGTFSVDQLKSTFATSREELAAFRAKHSDWFLPSPPDSREIVSRLMGFQSESQKVELMSAGEWLSHFIHPSDPQSRGMRILVEQQLREMDTPDLQFIQFQQTCGTAGSHANAFYDFRFRKVVFCPGLLLTTHPVNATFVIGHEIAHDWFDQLKPEQVAKLRGCFKTHYDPEEPHASERLSEIFSDLVGVNYIAKRLETAGFTHEQAFAHFRDATRFLCPDRSGQAAKAEFEKIRKDPHPSGLFRIRVIAGRNPELRRVLGCSPWKGTKPYCELGARP